METAGVNLNPFLNIEATPKKKVKLEPRRILPVESPVVCGQEGQEMPGSVFESAVERFDSVRSQAVPVPVVPQPGHIFINSGLFYPSPAQEGPGPSTGLSDGNLVNGKGVQQPSMVSRDPVGDSVQPARGLDGSCALGTASQSSVLNRSAVGLVTIQEQGVERSSGV